MRELAAALSTAPAPTPVHPSRTSSAVFSVYKFHFTYCLTLIHTLTTWAGMQGFLRVRRPSARHGHLWGCF